MLGVVPYDWSTFTEGEGGVMELDVIDVNRLWITLKLCKAQDGVLVEYSVPRSSNPYG